MSIFVTDQGKFQVTETGEGFLKGVATISRAMVFDYLVEEGDDVKVVKKVKLPADLFSKATQDSVEGKPVTDGHPIGADGKPILVKPTNYKQLARGALGAAYVIGDELRAPEIIYDEGLIADIKDGRKKEVSIGFVTEDAEEPGTYDGQEYQVRQRSIEINHLAHVDVARGGKKVRFHYDMKEATMKFRTDDGKELTIDGANAQDIFSTLTKLQSERDGLKGQVGDLTGKLTTADGEIKKLKDAPPVPQADADKVTELGEKLQNAVDAKTKAEAELKKIQDGQRAAVREAAKARVALEKDAEVAKVTISADMSDRAVMEQVISQHLPYADGVKVSEKPEAAIADRFEAVMDSLRKKANEQPANDGGKRRVPTTDEIEQKRQGLKNMHLLNQADKK